MSKSVVVRSQSRLSCSGQESPTVVLCLNSDTLLADGSTTIEGTITKSYKDSCSCECTCTPSWNYIVSYDNTLLTDPNTALTSSQIDGIFCKGCLTQWVEDLIGSLVPCITNPTEVDYVWPTTAGTPGQQLTIDTVVGTTVTLKWA